MNTQYECNRCHWKGPESDIRSIEIYPQTETQPADYEWRCPGCNSEGSITPVEIVTCRQCEDEPVQHEGDLCTECYTEMCERHVDAARGH